MKNLDDKWKFMSTAAKQVLGLMLAMDAGNHQIAFENIPIETPEALASLRATGKLLFYQLPLLEINDQKLS